MADFSFPVHFSGGWPAATDHCSRCLSEPVIAPNFCYTMGLGKLPTGKEMMDKTLEAKVIESLRHLPEQYQSEALDFIEFLKTRQQTKTRPRGNAQAEGRARIVRKYEEIRAHGGPQIEEVIKKLGGPWPSPPDWNSTDFIRQDRDRH